MRRRIGAKKRQDKTRGGTHSHARAMLQASAASWRVACGGLARGRAWGSLGHAASLYLPATHDMLRQALGRRMRLYWYYYYY